MRLKSIAQNNTVQRLTDLFARVVPISALVGMAAYIAAQQAVSPQRRVIKVAVLLGLMAFMLRFDLVYSVYLFTILFPFPSGVSVGSTNSILMTLIPLIWMVRAASTKSAIYFKRTKVDFAIALFLFTYVLSFINVETTEELRNSLRVFWRTAATVMFFYTIVTFVNDEKKIFTLVKISCSVCGFLMFTALLEFFMPGQSIIPGWIGFSGRAGMGEIGFRIEGMRVGGALKSQAMMADFASRTLFLLIFLTIKTRNYFEKTIWAAIGVMCLVTIAATANRGAVTSVSIAGIYLYYLFRKQISIAQVLVLMGAIAMLLALSEVTLTRYTNAVSLSDRLRGTYFTGAIPDSRKNTWKPAFRRSLEHPFIGHGPYYDIGEGLTYKMWPHNGLIFYFYTIGLFGLMAFLAVVYQVWKYTLSYKLPHVRGSPLADLSKVLGAVLVATAVQQMRTDHQREDIYPYMIWFIFGLIATTGIVLEELSKKRANQEPEPGGGGVAEGAKRRLRRQPLKRLRS